LPVPTNIALKEIINSKNENSVIAGMNIAFLAPEFLPNWGGAGTYAIEMVNYLSKKNHDVHVITLERNIAGSPVHYTEDEILDFFDDRIHLHTISSATDTFLYNAGFQYAVFKKLPAICRTEDIDIVHGDMPHMSDILVKCFRFPIPIVTTVHTLIEGHRDGILASGLNFSDMEISEKYTLAIFPFLKLVQNLYLKKTNHIITVSNWMKRYLEKSYPGNRDISMIYNGVDHKKFYPDNRSRSFSDLDSIEGSIVLFSSRFTVAKGLNYLIQAMPEIIRGHDDIHFVFCGAGSVEPWVNMLNRLGVNKRYYSFLGYIDYSALPSVYAKCSIYVAPTLHENFPIRVLEAMSSGRPVVASRIYGIPEMIDQGKNGLLIRPGQPEEISEAIRFLLDNPGVSEQMGRNARETVLLKFTWEKAGQETEQIYEQILSLNGR
jgi:glycosyltransferase involved in cell wall biosynthesis